MTRKTDDVLVDHAIDFILDGHSIKDAWRELHISYGVIKNRLRVRGLVLENMNGQRKKLPDHLIVADYQSGMSEVKVAEKYGVTRPAVRNRLKEAGVHIRNVSETNLLAAARDTSENRQQRCKAANEALRGGHQPRAGRLKLSINKEITGGSRHLNGPGEDEFAELLGLRKIKFTRQKSVEVYNIDIAIRRVALELRTANHIPRTKVSLKRIEDLSKRGYRVLHVCFDAVEDLLWNADYIISWANRLNRKPTSGRKYWVIRSRFEKFSRDRDKRNQFTAVAIAPKLFAACYEFEW